IKSSFRLARLPISRASSSLLRSQISRTPFIAPSRSFSSTPIPHFSRSISKMAGGNVVEIKTVAEWKANVAEAKGPVVVDFHATWCGPCKAIAPAIEKLSETHEHIKFYKVDVDELGEVAAENGISAMPTFLFFNGGEKIETVRGANPLPSRLLLPSSCKWDRHDLSFAYLEDLYSI
ncbi:Thioredoxin, partial [Penicillium herquei]